MPTTSTQPIISTYSDPGVWIAPFICGVVCLAFLVVLLFSRKSIARWLIVSPRWAKAFSALAALLAILGWVISGTIDFSSAMDNRFQPGFGLRVAILIVVIGAYLAVSMLLYARDSESEKTEKDLARVQAANDAHERRRAAIGEIVNGKAQSVRDALKNRKPGQPELTRADLLKIFQPKIQFSANFIALYKHIRAIIGPNGTLRLAVFLPSSDRSALRVRLSYDGHQIDCITTPNTKYADRFRLIDNPQKCLAVHASLQGGLYVISDTDRVRGDYRDIFAFFDGRQKAEIKSIFAYGYRGNDSDPNPVIAADSNRKKAFRDDDEFRRVLEVELQEFGNRLLFEADVFMLLGE